MTKQKIKGLEKGLWYPDFRANSKITAEEYKDTFIHWGFNSHRKVGEAENGYKTN